MQLYTYTAIQDLSVILLPDGTANCYCQNVDISGIWYEITEH